MYKTPDALFTGEATTKVIESCCPFIKDASRMPTLDVDSIVTAIRIATFGEMLTVNHSCPNCANEDSFEIDLKVFLDYFSSLTFDNKIQVGDLLVTLKPLSYQELTEVNIENFKLQKMLRQVQDMASEEDQQKQVDLVYKNLADIQTQLFIKSIESVQIPEGVVDQVDFISDWVKNSDRILYEKIKEKLESNKNKWQTPPQPVKCSACGTEDTVTVNLDQSNFFVQG
jgi:hypothetical protein